MLLIIPHCLQRIGGRGKKITKLITAGAKVIAPQEAKATTERNAIIKKECQEADGAAAYHSSLPSADRWKRKKVTKLITAGAKVIAPQEAKATTERNAIIKKSVKRRTGLLLIIPHCLQRIGGKRKTVTKLITAGAKVIAPQEAKATTERNAIIKKECQE